MFVTVDGEDIARKVFRRAKICINCEGTERKIKEIIKKNRILIYLRDIFQSKI